MGRSKEQQRFADFANAQFDRQRAEHAERQRIAALGFTDFHPVGSYSPNLGREAANVVTCPECFALVPFHRADAHLDRMHPGAREATELAAAPEPPRTLRAVAPEPADDEVDCPVGDPDCTGTDGDCHDACEPPDSPAGVAAATFDGLLVPGSADPVSVPVRLYDGRWILLRPDGTYAPTEAP